MMQGAKGNAAGQGPAHKALIVGGGMPPDPRSGKSVVEAAPAAPAKRTQPRLKGFDYSRPFFYMVTLKRLPGLAPFSQIAEGEKPERFLIENETTRAFTRVVRSFHTTCRGLAPIECFTVMPDHLHLLMKLEPGPDTKPLGTYVHWLMRALARAYWAHAPGHGPVHKTPTDGRGLAPPASPTSVGSKRGQEARRAEAAGTRRSGRAPSARACWPFRPRRCFRPGA